MKYILCLIFFISLFSCNDKRYTSSDNNNSSNSSNDNEETDTVLSNLGSSDE